MAKDALVSIQFWSCDFVWLWNVAGGSTGNEGRGVGGWADPVEEMESEFKKKKWIEVIKPEDKCWLDEMGDAATLLSKRFRRSLEQAQMKREWSKKKKREGQGDTPTPPLWITVQISYPIRRVGWSWWPTALDQLIDCGLVWWGIVELSVCNPHLLLFIQPYLCKMDFYSTWHTVCSCVRVCVVMACELR